MKKDKPACPALMDLLSRKRGASHLQLMKKLHCDRRCLHERMLALQKSETVVSEMRKVKHGKSSQRWERFYWIPEADNATK